MPVVTYQFEVEGVKVRVEKDGSITFIKEEHIAQKDIANINPKVWGAIMTKLSSFQGV